MPIVSTLASASSKGYGEFVGGGFSNAFESIATQAPSSNTNTIEFTNIPQVYKHLHLRFYTLTSSFSSGAYFKFNNDTTVGNYNHASLYANGSGTGVGYYSGNAIFPNFCGGTSDEPGIGILDIHDYANSNFYKTWRGWDGCGKSDGSTATGYTEMIGGYWASTSPITSMKFTFAGATFNVGTVIAMYGVRG